MNETSQTIAKAIGATLVGDGQRQVVEAATNHQDLPPQNGLFVALPGKTADGHMYVEAAKKAGASAALIHTNWQNQLSHLATDFDLIATQDVLDALWTTARWQRSRMTGRVVAITGSCGKTTTRAMLHALLTEGLGPGTSTRSNQNNQIGTPLTLLRVHVSDPFLIAELGTNSPGEIAALASLVRPHIAILTGIMRAHLEGLGDVQGVLQEKSCLAHAVPSDGAIVIPGDDPLLVEASKTWKAKVLTFGSSRSNTVQILDPSEGLTCSGRLRVNDEDIEVHLPLPGIFNLRNAAAALAVAIHEGVDTDACRRGFLRFVPEKLRMHVRQLRGVTFLVDAYNANPDSMTAALRCLASLKTPRRAVVLGTMNELGQDSPALHREVGLLAATLGVDLIVPIEQDLGPYAEGARKAARHTLIRPVKTKEAAAEVVREWMNPGDIVLLKGSRTAQLEDVLKSL